MDKDVIKLSYTELRLMTEKVLSYVRDLCGDNDQISLKSRLENDLGMTGDDVSEFLTSFSAKFEVDFTDFDFRKHFNEEGFPISELLVALPILVFVVSFNVFKTLIDLSGFRFVGLEKIKHINYPGKIREIVFGYTKEDLKIEDLVVSYITMKFRRRQEVHFE